MLARQSTTCVRSSVTCLWAFGRFLERVDTINVLVVFVLEPELRIATQGEFRLHIIVEIYQTVATFVFVLNIFVKLQFLTLHFSAEEANEPHDASKKLLSPKRAVEGTNHDEEENDERLRHQKAADVTNLFSNATLTDDFQRRYLVEFEDNAANLQAYLTSAGNLICFNDMKLQSI